MSTPTFEKISILRGFLGLTRIEFSESIGISINTLKAIEQKGVTPKSDILVRIASTWPKYANWLLLGLGTLESLEAIDIPLEKYLVIDSVNAKYMDQCIVKTEHIKKLIFLQSDSDEDLAAILLMDLNDSYSLKKYEKNERCVWIKPGNMNFTRSNGGGWLALITFREWLMKKNSDLVFDAEYYEMPHDTKNIVYETAEIEKSCLKVYRETKRFIKFQNWKKGIGY